jgi:hypothetical protein
VPIHNQKRLVAILEEHSIDLSGIHPPLIRRGSLADGKFVHRERQHLPHSKTIISELPDGRQRTASGDSTHPSRSPSGNQSLLGGEQLLERRLGELRRLEIRYDQAVWRTIGHTERPQHLGATAREVYKKYLAKPGGGHEVYVE